MELRFNAMLYSDLGNENVHFCRIWPAGRQFPTPALNGAYSSQDFYMQLIWAVK